MKIYGNLVDIHIRDIYPACVTIQNKRISNIEKVDFKTEGFILPGLIDSHIHIESSMITPGAFAKTAVTHGTTGVVSDPHEIANVLGIDGVRFMIEDAAKVPLKFWFGASSCVPATFFETSGASIGVEQIRELLHSEKIKYLAEMMNFPGVICNDPDVLGKISIAKELGKPVDGHAPGLTGDELKMYVSAGITTDHECSTIEEALEKLNIGMKILIREGSAARNLDSLKDLFHSNPDNVMLCSDDLHPEMLQKRHLNVLIGDLISEGYNVFDIIRSCTINPVSHYGLEAGLLKIGEFADFIVVNSLEKMMVQETWLEGVKVFDKGNILFSYDPGISVNNFNSSAISLKDIEVLNKAARIKVIEAFQGELLTKTFLWSAGSDEIVVADPSADILKIVVKDRYKDSPPVVGFIKGFGMKRGAFASSIAHDSHNIIAIGTNDTDIVDSINRLVEMKGGLAVSCDEKIDSLELNIGGIMSTRSCGEVASDYERLSDLVKNLGCSMAAPFMTLSFMALLVIPDLKISDKGLFDVKKFCLVSLFDE